MNWNLIGWLAATAYTGVGVALPILYPEYKSSGYFFLLTAGLAGLLTVIVLVHKPGASLRARIGMGRTMLIGGLTGTWLFLTFTVVLRSGYCCSRSQLLRRRRLRSPKTVHSDGFPP